MAALDQQAVLLQLVEEAEPSIRYCSYQMGRQNTAVPAKAQLLEASDPAGKAGLDAIKARLASLAAEAQHVQAQGAGATSALEWAGRFYPVTSERVQACLAQAAECAAKISAGTSLGTAGWWVRSDDECWFPKQG